MDYPRSIHCNGFINEYQLPCPCRIPELLEYQTNCGPLVELSTNAGQASLE
jgi:hypothetical protein